MAGGAARPPTSDPRLPTDAASRILLPLGEAPGPDDRASSTNPGAVPPGRPKARGDGRAPVDALTKIVRRPNYCA